MGSKEFYTAGVVGGAITGYRAGKKAEGMSKLSVDDVLKADKSNFVIPKSDIIEVKLKLGKLKKKLEIKTKTKDYKWAVGGIPGKKWKSETLKDYCD